MALKTYHSLYHVSLDYPILWHGDRPGEYIAHDPVDGQSIYFKPVDGKLSPSLAVSATGADPVSAKFIFYNSGWKYCPECHGDLLLVEATTYVDEEDRLYIAGDCIRCSELVEMEVIPRRFPPKET